ncbi:DUF4256 domain-containing protein [Shewanella cyperi]|uniref:DUF4256 domain-containing protein n=1 Tax=Shewanella cyperi TaxID=2814292 RepID=UPI001A94F357|nr:DUF4256 domain-containing protein [Shewanella cyperi]QSX40568.1 DUF4256 domain-containing protein [Shewanella cyperi]
MDATHQALIQTLKTRFEQHPRRHPDIDWMRVQDRLETCPDKLDALQYMEQSGGEPDVIGFDATRFEFIFCDCAPESPTDRRSLCYDAQALEARKQNKPAGSAVAMAAAMGIELLTEAQYQELQTLGEFDLKTSSWLATTADIRDRGGAIFGDRRFGRVFVYHNGAESYYSARGFRGRLLV